MGLAQALDLVWSQSHPGGECKLGSLYGKYCETDKSFPNLFLVSCVSEKWNAFVKETCFVHLEKC